MQCHAFFSLFLAAAMAATTPKTTENPLIRKLSVFPKVVFFSFGSLRNKFLKTGLDSPLKELRHLVNFSTAAPEYLKPVFPAKTPVNHFSIATGMYAGKHGVMDNCKYDEPDTECKYELYPEDLNPIWTENQENGGSSGVIRWPGSDKPYRETTPSYYQGDTKEYKQKDNEARLQMIIDWMMNENNPANLVMAYFGELDEVIHSQSVRSKQTREELRKIDDIVKPFVAKLKDLKLENEIDVIAIGSQGIHNVKYEGGIYLNCTLSYDTSYVAMGANALVTPKKGEFNTVYQILKDKAKNEVSVGTQEKPKVVDDDWVKDEAEDKTQSKEKIRYSVYKQDEIPDEWHLQDLTLCADKIFLVANPGYFFWNDYLDRAMETQRSNNQNFVNNDFEVGMDGYSNDGEYMRTFFMAVGPHFEVGKRVAAFETIDIYPLLRFLLGLTGEASVRQSRTKMNDAVVQLLAPEVRNQHLMSANIAARAFPLSKSTSGNKPGQKKMEGVP